MSPSASTGTLTEAAPGSNFSGETVAEKRVNAMSSPEVDRVRRILCHEPRGHADMYGGFITPPDDDGAHFGVLFWHKDGFSTACGHGTMALGTWAVDTGIVEAPQNGSVDVGIDVPSGRVTATVHRRDGKVTGVDFVNVPGYLIAEGLEIETSRGAVTVDVSYGGAMYAQVDVEIIGDRIAPERSSALIDLGREIKWLLNDLPVAQHPADPRLSGIYGTILYESVPSDDPRVVAQRNTTIFADGELDRSPCGSGTCARVATLAAQSRLPAGTILHHGSIVGSTFTAEVLETTEADGYPAVIPKVSGAAFRTGSHTFTVDPDDPLVPGFVLR